MAQAEDPLEWMMYDHKAEATSNSRRASARTRKAGRDAREAEAFYQTAAEMGRQAAWLTRRPDLWQGNYTPADLEARRRIYIQVADRYLRGSFRADADAEFYRGIAARYRQMTQEAQR